MAIEATRDLCLSVADAIREKKGSSDLINPQDFAKEIASIEGGGNGGGGGERRYAYITNESYKSDFALGASLSSYVSMVKMNFNGMTIASPSLLMMVNSVGGNIEPIALSIDLDMVAYTPEGNLTFEEALAQTPAIKEMWEALPKLTKEQFYDLNA